MLGRATGAAAVAVGLLGACSLSLDGYTGGAPDAGSRTTMPDGNVVTTVSDSGTDAGTPNTCDAALDHDPNNCGACGKSCLGGQCSGAKCQPKVISSVFDRPLGVAWSQGKLYVGDHNTIVELDPDGDNAKAVVGGVEAHYVVANDTDVIFSDQKSNTVRIWSHDQTGDTKPLTTTTYSVIEGVALTPNAVIFARYLAQNAGGGVYSVPYPGGGSATLVKPWNAPEGVAWAADTIYLGSDQSDSAIASPPSGPDRTLISGGGPTGIYVVGNDAYITRQEKGDVLHIDLGTNAVTTLATNQKGPSGIMLAPNGALYWVNVDDDTLVVTVP